MNHDANNFISLKKEQREAVGLLSIGTFLEYFDIQLYVHMAVILNVLFFPKTDPHMASLIAAFGFCSTYFFRPLGALFFGWIGDTVGRKTTVVVTIFIMAFCCLVIAVLPTYEQIGISAAVILTVCRIIQGMACTGESTGSELYLTETTKPPIQYVLVSMLTVFTALGTMVALGVATIVTSLGMNWRIVFLFGAMVAVVGSVARTTLKETPEFTDAKRKVKLSEEIFQQKIIGNKNKELINKEKATYRTMVAYFFMHCTRPIGFYFAYIYCGNILKDIFGYSAEQIISHNFILSIVDLIGLLFLALLSYKVYPLKILKVKLIVFCLFLSFSPWLLKHAAAPIHIGLIQSFAVFFVFDEMPGVSILYKHFPVFKRFTYASVLHALARAFMYVVVSFGLVFLTKYFASYALMIIGLPLGLGFWFGLEHFTTLEKTVGNYPQKETLNDLNLEDKKGNLAV